MMSKAGSINPPGSEFKRSEFKLVILLRVLEPSRRARQRRQLRFLDKRLPLSSYNNYT